MQLLSGSVDRQPGFHSILACELIPFGYKDLVLRPPRPVRQFQRVYLPKLLFPESEPVLYGHHNFCFSPSTFTIRRDCCYTYWDTSAGQPSRSTPTTFSRRAARLRTGERGAELRTVPRDRNVRSATFMDQHSADNYAEQPGLAAGAVVRGRFSIRQSSPARVEFDSSLLEMGLASFYQISYRFAPPDHDTTHGDIYRHYNQFVAPNWSRRLVPWPQTVGPRPIFSRFRPLCLQWVIGVPNPPTIWPTRNFRPRSAQRGDRGTSGLYQLKLDLFDSSGNVVDIATAGITYYVPTTTEPMND